MKPLLYSLTGLVLTLLYTLPAEAAPVTEAWLQAETDRLREEHGVIALGAGVSVLDKAPVVTVSGTARKGDDTPATAEDAWHIGSNSKALTALLYARLVDQGRAEWGATLPELFPALAPDMDAAWSSTTIEDLLAHRSGVGDIGALWLVGRRGDERPLTEQRLDTVRARLLKPPQGEPGSFEYSNLNYMIAGAAIEQITGMSWEEAITTLVLEAGDGDWAEGWGFGPPPTAIEGHRKGLLGLRPAGRGAGADNPPALGPAGTLHAPIRSHLLLLMEFLREGDGLVSAEQRAHLLRPWPNNEADYALGWGLAEDEVAGPIYRHNGSNTMWLSRVELVPDHDAAIVVNANHYTDASLDATAALVDAIEARLAASAD